MPVEVTLHELPLVLRAMWKLFEISVIKSRELSIALNLIFYIVSPAPTKNLNVSLSL